MCVDEVSAFHLFYSSDAIGEPSSMRSSMKRDAIWANGLYHREASLRSSHPFSLQVKIPRRMSNSVGEFVVENVFSIH